MKKRKVVRIIALVLAMLMPISTASLFTFAGNDARTSQNNNSVIAEKYQKPDVNQLTGHGEEPDEISVSAGATYQEKAWYEYINYSEHAVASYRVDDDYRLLFYDPYTYTNAMIMDVKFDATTSEFDTMSEYTVSNTTSKTITTCSESTFTNTSATQTSGKDEYGTEVTNGGFTHTKYNYDEKHTTEGTVKEDTNYHYKKREYDTSSHTIGNQSSLGAEIGSEIGLESKIKSNITTGDVDIDTTTTDHHIEWYQDSVTKETQYIDGYKTVVTHDYEYDVEDNTTSTTEGWEQLAARVTKTVGSSTSTCNSWSEEESTTVTKKYAATHFASDGVTPLPWAIVHYSVQMPMKCCLQVKYSGEWITISTVYCLLTTIKGTCRSWVQNGQIYYEDWGSGEPVVEANFWSQFMTKEQLIKAYNNKLYPTGGED